VILIFFLGVAGLAVAAGLAVCAESWFMPTIVKTKNRIRLIEFILGVNLIK
jgi:hypothetical protein